MQEPVGTIDPVVIVAGLVAAAGPIRNRLGRGAMAAPPGLPPVARSSLTAPAMVDRVHASAPISTAL